MKNTILLTLIASILLFAGCERDPFLLDLTRYDVFWNDFDASGTRTLDDEVLFNIEVNTTANDAEDQFILGWELSYTVNGVFAGVLTGNDHENSNTLNVNATVIIYELDVPGPAELQPGDVVEFRFWVVDNQGVELEEFYTFPLAP